MRAQRTLDLINAALERNQDKEHRTHLGASVMGNKCLRECWYVFRWAFKELHEGRMLRLFDRGHQEEHRFRAWIEDAGIEFWPVDTSLPVDPITGKHPQFRVSDHGGHFGGSLDGIGRGSPDLPPGVHFLFEFKTHNDASFKNLVREGLCGSKPEHFVQTQIYMRKKGLQWCIYLGINKNDDDIFPEVISCNTAEADRLIGRAGQVVASPVPPARITERKNDFLCKWCNFKEICHRGAMPERNCRTCQFSVVLPDAKWGCSLHKVYLSKENQRAGCQSWRLIPGFHK